MKNNKTTLPRSRRGITITEVVIALAIIGIVSAASLSVVMYAVNVEKESFSVVEAKTAAENIVACFRYAENDSEFAEALCKTGPYEPQADGSWRLIGNGYTVTVKADYTQSYVEYTAVNADGEAIYTFRYPRTSVQGGAP